MDHTRLVCGIDDGIVLIAENLLEQLFSILGALKDGAIVIISIV
jgi:hypothetical protein